MLHFTFQKKTLYIAHGTAICHNPHTIHQTVISILLDSWVTNTFPVKILHLQKILFPYTFVKI